MMINEGPTVDRVSARIVERILGAEEPADEQPGNRIDTLVKAMAVQHGETVSAEDLTQTIVEVQLQTRTGKRRMK
jgi:hypothetical protein